MEAVYTGLLHLHNFLRWVILLLLLITIFQSLSNSRGRGLQKTSLFLMIAAHIQFVIGLFQYFAGSFGFKLIQSNGFGEVMKNSAQRFWAVEHMLGMLFAIAFITIARGKIKRGNYRGIVVLYVLALIFILAVVPWPFREEIARPWFPGAR